MNISLLTRPKYLFISLAVIALLIAASCGGNGATEAPTTTPPSPSPTSLSDPSATSAAVAPDLQLPDLRLDDLDANAIVAAQEQVINQIYERSLPSITHIRVVQRVDGSGNDTPFGLPSPFGDDQGGLFRRGEGSGFVWDQQGRVVTNFHVIANADRVMVILSDGTEVEAEILGSDPDSDLAVLQVEVPDGGLPAVNLGDSDALKVGQLVTAIGNPFGQEFTITSGIVSALGRTIRSGNSPFSIPKVIQTDAAINPGNSGGPLLDREGRVIGINTQIITQSGANSGIGFAIPINTAKQVVPSLISEGRFEYAWLGISGQPVDTEVANLMDLPDGTRGALVVDVTKDGPADDGGVRGSDKTTTVQGVTFALGGDVITAIDGVKIEGLDDLIAYLNQRTRPGDQVVLEVIRDGKDSQEITVKLGARPELR